VNEQQALSLMFFTIVVISYEPAAVFHAALVFIGMPVAFLVCEPCS
jgi:hypothetical protein